MRLKLGISTCPNDTFAFHGILNRAVDLGGLEFETELLDIQELNDGAAADRFDVAKVSFHAALHLTDRFVVMPVGGALGFGVGPLLLTREERPLPGAGDRVLTPGRDTTAALLLRCLHPSVSDLESAHFASIMPRLADGSADYGVVIHEGRFTYEQLGLHCLQDLGEQWERQTGSPVPLGGLVARRSLGPVVLDRITQVVRASLRLAESERDAARETMRRWAQEFDDAVLDHHVKLYVNAQTHRLDDEGRSALEAMERLAREAGLVAPNAAPLEVAGD